MIREHQDHNNYERHQNHDDQEEHKNMAMRKNTKPLQLGRTLIVLTFDYLALSDKINSQKLSY